MGTVGEDFKWKIKIKIWSMLEILILLHFVTSLPPNIIENITNQNNIILYIWNLLRGWGDLIILILFTFLRTTGKILYFSCFLLWLVTLIWIIHTSCLVINQHEAKFSPLFKIFSSGKETGFLVHIPSEPGNYYIR